MQIRMNLHNIQLSKSKKICLNHGKSSRSDTNIEWFNYLSPDPLAPLRLPNAHSYDHLHGQ